MGNLINKVKVKCDFDNGPDKNFVFTILSDGTKKDVQETVNAALRQKIEEGELSTQNLRGIEIKSNDERGFFATIAGDVKGLLEGL